MLKHSFHLAALVLLIAGLAACGGGPAPLTPTAPPATLAPTGAPTSAPTSAPTAGPTAGPTLTAVNPTAAPVALPTTAPFTGTQIALQATDNSIRLIDPNGGASLLYNAGAPVDLASIFPPGNVISATLYLPLSGSAGAVRAGVPGPGQKLDWIKGPVYGLAVSASRVAWGTADLAAKPPVAQIQLSALDGSGLKTGMKESPTGAPHVLRVMRFSRNGARLYFGKEPVGIGGYILFAGLTNLWALDVATGKSTQLLAARSANASICLDDLSPNDRLVADHCKLKNMEVTDITTHVTKTIAAPKNPPAFQEVGGARFSPDNTRLAYGLARHDPNNEQGWVALADVAHATSTLIATSPAKDYFSVAAWLDANTLVLQSAGQTPGIWTVKTDGSNLKRLGDGTFVGLVRK